VRNYSLFTRYWFLLPSRPWLRPQHLPSSALLHGQPLSLLFSTLRSSALQGEDTYGSRVLGWIKKKKRSAQRPAKGPMAQTGTAEHCLTQAHSWAKTQAPAQPQRRQRAVALGPQRFYEKFNYRDRCGFAGFSGSAPSLRPPPLGPFLRWRTAAARSRAYFAPPPLGSAACRLYVWGPNFFLWGPRIGAASGGSPGHVSIERKHSNTQQQRH
jgi:hypothetical protein